MTDDVGTVVVSAVCDRATGTIALHIPGLPRISVDEVTARGLWMLLGEAAYVGVDPTGPYLRMRRSGGDA